jgi:ADP-heptose:LPS heptosyltransferase
MSDILVIKLGSLGDFVQAFGPFAAIRAHHRADRITLLTTKPYAALAAASPWFDEVWADGRPKLADGGLMALLRRMRARRFARVYDLQTSGRSTRYRWALGRGVEWSGLGRFASHPHANPGRNHMHTVERQREQLEMAGITRFPPPELGWLEGDVSGFGLPPRFALLIPGGSAHRPGKRWPAEAFRGLAQGLGLPVVVLGHGEGEAALARTITEGLPGAVSLVGRTGFSDIAALARRAAFAVGNDTGPTHLVAAAGCPTLALFGAESDPALCAPRGPSVAVLRHLPLPGLTVEQVRTALSAMPRP